ncbi:hypothetical protein BGZ81_010199, partial [Podila clonocystis]
SRFRRKMRSIAVVWILLRAHKIMQQRQPFQPQYGLLANLRHRPLFRNPMRIQLLQALLLLLNLQALPLHVLRMLQA